MKSILSGSLFKKKNSSIPLVLSVSLACMICQFATPAYAEKGFKSGESEEVGGNKRRSKHRGRHKKHRGHSYHQNTFGIFSGATKSEDDTVYTYGIEYEFRLNQEWGVGVVYEKSEAIELDLEMEMDGDSDSDSEGEMNLSDLNREDILLTLAEVYYHADEWRIAFGVGQEKEADDTEGVIRLGLEYEFDVGGFGVAPGLNFDKVGDEIETVFGVTFSKGF